mmetsp:Transcript_13577/g.20401  ORF Transcript_13577/g.20401 Transcript_13577/m.20401 type:complete len:350 (+) Transcript_13577:84-1133(+)|eukprot:CAMPEP_0167747316 /NCGR_PEP_ID=MMETSP0110_2-20121227/4216_1 /TAXON_ID=629695 /ORGANISM="Gymnochlora sp., Strain CCMP2014" /LENGTH=349 /DNA_ID=CAMNT_0007632209 /DNA_START=38 /DNA_END=1087 /DNA_ORIENTATION=-
MSKQAISKKVMKAVVVTEYKAWEEQDFTPVEVPIPQPADDQILVKVKAAAMNPIDWKVIVGMTKGFGWAQPNPLIPGYDLAGIVEAVGSDVKDYKVGDAVFAVNWAADRGQLMGAHDDNAGEKKKGPVAGAFAEYAVIPASKVTKKDAKVSFEQAAAVALVGTTAYQALKHLKIGKGTKLMVLGGSGAVGHVAIQIAKAMGAEVTTTASNRTKSYVKKSGVDKIVNYREEKWEELKELQGIDAVLDTVGNPDSLDKAKKVVKHGGRFLTIANFDLSLADSTKQRPRFDYAGLYLLKNNVKDQEYLQDLMLKGQLKVGINKQFSFTKSGVTDAFKAQAGGKSMGKNVIVF